MKATNKRQRRKLEKKRKAERMRRAAQPDVLAYTGGKYRKESLVPLHLATETGIYEAFVVSDRQVTDHDVRESLTDLILDLRRGHLGPLEGLSVAQQEAFGPPDLLGWLVQQRWHDYAAQHGWPGRDNLVGVLRTILGSIDTWSTASPRSRGYLEYLEGFLGKLGVSVQKLGREEVEGLPANERHPW